MSDFSLRGRWLGCKEEESAVTASEVLEDASIDRDSTIESSVSAPDGEVDSWNDSCLALNRLVSRWGSAGSPSAALALGRRPLSTGTTGFDASFGTGAEDDFFVVGFRGRPPCDSAWAVLWIQIPEQDAP